MITLEKFQEHLVLYCKGHYYASDVDFVEGLKRIWAIRCGYDYKNEPSAVGTYIANELYKIITICLPYSLPHIQELLHRSLGNRLGSSFKPDNLEPIDIILWEYKNIIAQLQVKKEQPDGKYETLIKLPKPKKQLFNRIVRGNGKYGDYKLVTD